MNCRIAGTIVVGLAGLLPGLAPTFAPASSRVMAQNAPAKDTLVLDLPSNQWFEGPLESVTVSPNGNWALVHRRGTPSHATVQLYSLKTGLEDPATLIADLTRVDNAEFFGASGIARLGERGTETGWFLPAGDSEQLSSLPADAVAIFTADSRELAYYRSGIPSPVIFVKAQDQVRDYEISGRVTSMAFSPDRDYFYDLLFQASGESSLVRISVNTGATKVMASHLDASPMASRMALSADGRELYLALATDGAPNNEARHQPEADRWLKIYELDLATGARRAVVDSPGQDNSSPAIVKGNLYWTRTVFNDSVVVIPAAGGEAKEIVAGGQVPMWSPDSHRIGYTFGGSRLADWGLDLDDAVVSLDDQGNRASPPAVIVSGYHEDFAPAWSPDGKWIAFHSHRSPKPVSVFDDPSSSDDIYLRRADDVHAPEIRLTEFGWETGPAYWSPDGQKLLFTSWDRNGLAGVDKLFVLTMSMEVGRVLRADMLPLPPEIRSVSWAAWSPDGEKIAIEDNRGGDARTLWTVHADGSHAEKLLDYKGATYDGIDWSPDGKTIVFSALAGDRLQLFAIPSTGGIVHQLTQGSGNLMHPRISPDGKWIACTWIVQSKQIWRRPLS
jgi:Tol biopolymer transport system component